MRITVSCTRSGLNFGFDKSAASQLLEGRTRFIVRYGREARSLIVVPSDKGYATYGSGKGYATYGNGTITYLTVRGGVSGHPKHDKIILLDGSIKKHQDGSFSIMIPEKLPSYSGGFKRKKPEGEVAASKRNYANMVMTIADMTICFSVPSTEALKMAFSMGAKGYMTETGGK